MPSTPQRRSHTGRSYRQFPTKDALATAYVQGRADAWFARMRQAAEEPATAAGKLMAVFGVLAADAGATDPNQLADELLIVLNGAYATAAVLDGATFGQRAVRLARLLIDDACPRLQAPATGSTIR
ncbi:hypothetical protein [Pseudarthrobacter sp. L1SW]|uniref:hypothetical protein n=1 Tax=Pseudarthrobacter sp. L1SW TaxID=2851598 RepID=UPI001E2A1103|nr:hypothetical protein [Pseudarthrobacter sp. L1SW]